MLQLSPRVKLIVYATIPLLFFVTAILTWERRRVITGWNTNALPVIDKSNRSHKINTFFTSTAPRISSPSISVVPSGASSLLTLAIASPLSISALPSFSVSPFDATYPLPSTLSQASPINSPTEPSLPSDYNHGIKESSYCAQRFSPVYLENLRDSRTEYCTENSATTLTCFHSQTESQRIDNMCFGSTAVYNLNHQQFVLDCKTVQTPISKASFQVPANASTFSTYMYETGPGYIFDKYIRNLLEPSNMIRPSTRNFSVLLKREGEGNPWHSLLEIFSLTLTFDVLRMARDPITKKALFTESDMANTQIIVLDDRPDGPYFDLWRLFAHKPILRLGNLTEKTPVGNIIVPLAGGSNTLWQGDWIVQSCEASELLRTFVMRVLSFYTIDAPKSSSDTIVITFIDRHAGRQLIDQDRLLNMVNSRIPHVEIRTVDFTPLTFKEQIQSVHDSDVLVGAHGAGLTHALWLRAGMSVAEILPHDLQHKGFRNMAQLLGHAYFSVHATEVPTTERVMRWKRDKWHTEDIFVEDERWLHLIEVAVANVYNKRERNFDVA